MSFDLYFLLGKREFCLLNGAFANSSNGLFDDRKNLFELKWLFDDGENIQSFQMGFDLLPGQGGKDDDFGIGLERFDFPDCMKAVLVIDLEIGEDEAVQSIFRLLYGFEAGGHGVHFVTFPGKDFLKRPANQIVIICHQNFVHIIINTNTIAVQNYYADNLKSFNP